MKEFLKISLKNVFHGILIYNLLYVLALFEGWGGRLIMAALYDYKEPQIAMCFLWFIICYVSGFFLHNADFLKTLVSFFTICCAFIILPNPSIWLWLQPLVAGWYTHHIIYIVRHSPK